jgi:phenylpyruvate tautomerase PptA (4-oxalocrotonate tautomerase family)
MLDKTPKQKTQQNLMQITQPRSSITPTVKSNNFFWISKFDSLAKKTCHLTKTCKNPSTHKRLANKITKPTQTFQRKKLENTRLVCMSQNPKNWILITQSLTYPKRQKSKIVFTL